MPEAPAYRFESDPQEQDQQENTLNNQSYDEGRLSQTEVAQLKKGLTSISQIVAERNQLKAAAEAEMSNLVSPTDDRDAVIDLREYKDLKAELEATDSADKTKEILDKIRDLPKQKERERAQDKEDGKELDPEDPSLKKLQAKFDQICKDNEKLIGTKQVPSFSQWFKQERQKQPNKKHLNNLIERLEGKTIQDRDGLAPRREEFQRLSKLYKKYGISDPTESKYIKEEGLSERQKYRTQLENLDKHFDKQKDTPFYDKESIQKMMQSAMMAKNPDAVANILKQAKAVSQKESEGFIHLESRISIAGKSILKMSKKSQKMYLEYYRTTTLEERKMLVSNWENLVSHEANLAKDLADVFGDKKEALAMALESFEEMDFMEKQKAIKDHEKKLKEESSTEKVQTDLTLKAVNAKLSTAANDNIIAKKTKQSFETWFKDKDKHKDPKTKRFSIDQLKKHYEILVSDKPDGKAQNLSAYKIKRDRFKAEVKELERINPDIDPKELTKWQDQYDKEGWTGRKAVYKKLKREQEKLENQGKRKEELAKEAGINLEEKEKKETVKNLEETIKAVSELMQNNQGAEAMKLLLEYNEQNPDEPKILFWISTVAQYIKEFGSGVRKEKTVEKELEKEAKEIAQNDENLKQELEDHQIKSLNKEGAKQNEQRHDNKISAHERARKESLSKVTSGTLEADLTEDAYKQMGKDYVLDKEGSGEKVKVVDFGYSGLGEVERGELRRKTAEQQTKIDDKTGFANVSLVQDGREVSAKEAERETEKERERLSEKLAAKATEKVENKSGSEGAEIIDIQAQIAAKRKARKIIENKEEEKLRIAS